MRTNTPKSLTISLSGDTHTATVRFEVADDAFRVVRLEDGAVISVVERVSLGDCMDYATDCADCGLTMLAPAGSRDVGFAPAETN